MTQQATRGYGALRTVEIRVTTVGSAGSATGTTTSPQIVGQIEGIEVDWHASAPGASSDITIEGATTGLDLYAKANAATDVQKVPGAYGVDIAATALTGDVTPQKLCIAEGIKVTVAQSDALTDCVIVRVTYRPVRSELITVNTTGEAGAATGTASSNPITGEILGMAIDFHASAAATTNITIEGATSGLNLYAKEDSVADAFVVPVLFSVDAGAAALTNDVTPRRYCVGEAIKVTLDECDELLAAVVVRVFYVPVEAETIAVTTTGADGSATGSASGIKSHGEILGLAINYHASAPGTTDIEVEGQSGINVYAKANSVTDVYVAPGVFAATAADGALSSNVTPERFVLGQPVKVSLAGCNALTDAVKVTVFSRR